MKRAPLLLIFPLFLLILSLFTGPGCANIVPPAGGPRDSIPPELLKAEPLDSTMNFKENRISLTFDDYVEVDNNYSQMLLVSPIPVNSPVINYRLNTVTIKLRDTLEQNTTYTIDFGDAIKDI